MNKNWLTYLFILAVMLFHSCGSAEFASEDKSAEMEYEDALAVEEEGEVEMYKEDSYEESVTEEAVEENSKSVVEGNTYTVMLEEQQWALEDRAVQKVKELFDYIDIMSNNDYDIEMRRSAKKMALNLFASKAELIAPSITNTDEAVMIKSFLKDILKGDASINNIVIESIGMNREMSEEVVSCLLSQDGKQIHLLFYLNMEFEVKKFGNTSQEVWSVYLGKVVEN